MYFAKTTAMQRKKVSSSIKRNIVASIDIISLLVYGETSISNVCKISKRLRTNLRKTLKIQNLEI